MDIENTYSINSIIINWETVTAPFNPVFFKLSIIKSFEIFTKYDKYGFIFEYFTLH